MLYVGFFTSSGAVLGYFVPVAPVWAMATIGFWMGISAAFFRTAYEYKKELFEHEDRHCTYSHER